MAKSGEHRLREGFSRKFLSEPLLALANMGSFDFARVRFANSCSAQDDTAMGRFANSCSAQDDTAMGRFTNSCSAQDDSIRGNYRSTARVHW